MSIQVKDALESEDGTLTLDLSLAEGEALKAWLLKPAADGSSAIDDEHAKSVMVKLGSQLDYISGVALVREELEHAGFDTETLSNEQIAELGRRIADSPIRRLQRQLGPPSAPPGTGGSLRSPGGDRGPTCPLGTDARRRRVLPGRPGGPSGGFWVALAGGVALARVAERRGARQGFGAGVAAMLETVAIIGPARFGVPLTQAITAPHAGAPRGAGNVAPAPVPGLPGGPVSSTTR